MLVDCEFVKYMNITKDFSPVPYPHDNKYYLVPNFPDLLIAKDGSVMRRNWKISSTWNNYEPAPWRIANNRYSYINVERPNPNYSEGRKKFVVSKVTLLAVMFLKKPSYFPECRVKFKDGNRNNETLENLEFIPRYAGSTRINKIKKRILKEIYTEPLKKFKDDVYPGFYYIPGFNKRYIINPNNFLMYYRKGENYWYLKKWKFTHEGYASTDLYYNNTIRIHMPRHQLLARMFLRDQITDDVDMNKAQIDHINEKPGDDRLCNLKIVMPIENVNNYFNKKNRRPTPKPVQTRNIDTGKITIYESAIACGRDNNLSRDQILYRLDHSNKIFPERNLYRIYTPETEDDPWPEIEDIDKNLSEFGPCEPILVKNCETGKITEYSSQIEFINEQKKLGIQICDTEFCYWFSRSHKVYRLAPNNYIQVKKKFDNKEFENIKHYRDEYLKTRKYIQPIVRTNYKTKEKVLFLTTPDCANACGFKDKYYIYNRLKRNLPEYVFPEGYQYRRYNSQLDLDMKFHDE